MPESITRWRSAIGRGELLLVAALLLIAIAVRLPYLWEIPRFTDETAEAEIGLRILRGESFPLTNRDPYIGALWNWILAAGFLVSGPSLFTPRVLIAIFGALTVVPAYLLGKSLSTLLHPTMGPLDPHGPPAPTGGRGGDRPPPPCAGEGWGGGLLAGLLLALSPAHVVVNSHIAWSNCLTPLFTALGLWLAHRAVAQDRPRLLVPSGLCFGLGLQTHPVGALLLPGVAVGVALARPRWLLGPWPGLAVLAALLGCANLLAANVWSGFAGVTYGGTVQAGYTGGEILTWQVYVERLRQTLWLLADSLAGVLAESGPLAGPFERRLGLVLLIASAVGIEALARRRDGLLFFAVISYLLLLPVVNGRFESSVPKARYIAPLLPICYAAMAVATVETSGWIGRLRPALAPRLAPSLLRGGVGALAAVLLLMPLAGLVDYYQQAIQERRTNAAFYQVVAGIEASRRPGERVFAERDALKTYTLGGGQWSEHIAFASQVYGWERQALDVPHPRVQIVPRIVGPLLVRASSASLMGKFYRVERVPGTPSDGTPVRLLYSLGPQPQLLTSERQDERDDVPRPPRPPRVDLFVEGVTFPSALQFAPDGRLFFNEILAGQVRIASASGELQPEPFVVLPTTKGLEQGALGLALDPEFARNRWVYVFYSEADAENRPTRNRVVRFTERDGRATEATAILDDLPINQTRYYNGDHNGGRIAFGPDGMLYVSLGEMVRRSQVPDPYTLYGKILRVRPDGTAPADNPYGDYPTYALGFRNVFGLTFHPTTGRLYATDNGPEGYDELNLVQPGRDYGYPSIEGGPGGVAGLEDPLWDSAEERLGITGLTFYSGSVFPEYAGDLFFCAFNTGALRRVRLAGQALDDVEWVEVVSHDCRLDVTNGPDGTLYFSDLARIFRLSR